MLHSFKGWDCTKWCNFMQGMMRLFARNVIFYEKYCCAEPILENFALTTNFKVHAETCLLIICSSLGCLVFLPMVLSNFLRGCSNYENISKKWTAGWCPAKFKVCNILLNLLLLLLKDVNMHCSKTSGKTEKAKTKNFSDNALVWNSCFVSPHLFVGFLLLILHPSRLRPFRLPPPRLPPPHTQLTHTLNLLTHNLLTHNLHTHTTYSRTTYSHTTCTHTHTSYSHTQLAHTHTQLTHTQLAHTHTQLAHAQLTHAQLTHTQLAHTHTQLTHTQLTHTHNLHTHNLLTHNLFTHNLFTHNSLTHNLLTHNLHTNTTHSHTTQIRHRPVHTQLVHTQLTHTQLTHTQLVHTQLTHTQLAHTHTQLTHTQLTPTHLLRNILSNYWCGMHLTCKNNSVKLTGIFGRFGVRNLSEVFLRLSSDAAQIADCENRTVFWILTCWKNLVPVLGLAGCHFGNGKLQVRFHRNIAASSLAADCNVPQRPPALKGRT